MSTRKKKKEVLAVQGAIWLTVGGENLGGNNRIALLQAIAENGSITQAAKALVFINVPYDINKALETLTYHGVQAESLHGEDKKMERKNTLERFRSGKTSVLIASELAARGLDIKDITHVFNVDVPESTDAYLHRAGRTGRTGKAGIAISLVAGKELSLIQKHAKVLRLVLKRKELVRGSLVEVRGKEIK